MTHSRAVFMRIRRALVDLIKVTLVIARRSTRDTGTHRRNLREKCAIWVLLTSDHQLL